MRDKDDKRLRFTVSESYQGSISWERVFETDTFQLIRQGQNRFCLVTSFLRMDRQNCTIWRSNTSQQTEYWKSLNDLSHFLTLCVCGTIGEPEAQENLLFPRVGHRVQALEIVEVGDASGRSGS